VVGADNRAQLRTVEVGPRVGPLWVITSGLKPGERVVAAGTEKARNGELVNPTPYKERRSANYGEFFHRRPIVSIVIAILTVIVGAITIAFLPIAQFPNIAPPEIWLQANYPGADAKTLEQSVATPIEQQVTVWTT